MVSKLARLSLLLALVALLQGAQGEICAGCPIEFDPNIDNSDDWSARIANTLNSINTDQPVHLIRLTKATSQVIDGVRYHFWAVTTVPGNTNAVHNCELTYVSRPWINKEPQLTGENCTSPVNEVRTAKQLLGGLKNVEPSEMGTVRELANFAVKTLDTIDTDNSRQVVAQIVDAKKQLVNGIMYHLQLRVRTTTCSEDEAADKNCPAKESEPEKYCKIRIHRSWADKSPLNAKVVESECEEAKTRTGGLIRLNVNDQQVQKLAEKAVERYNMMTNCLTLAGLVNIIKASSQVVNGNNVYLTVEIGDTDCTKNERPNGKLCKIINTNSDKHTVCDAVIWRKPAETTGKITSFDCKTEYYVNLPSNYRNKRDVARLGGISEADPNSPYMQELAKFAVSQFATTNNADYRYFKVLRATSQVVSGMKVTIEMAMGKSDCSKSNSGCRVCSVTIWDQPWTKTRQILDSDCYDRTTAALSLIGGETEKDPNDPDIVAYKNLVGSQATSRLNSQHTKAVVKILKATTQIVSGYLVKLTVELGDTDCLATENKDPSECNIVPTNGPAQICEVDILNQAWLNKVEVTNFDCSQTKMGWLPHTHRGMPGAPYDIDVNSPTVQKLTKYYLAQMDAQTNSDYRLGHGRIIRATNQIVAGSLTTITMEVGQSQCLKNVVTNDPCKAKGTLRTCTFTIFDQPWTHTMRIQSQYCDGSLKRGQGRGMAGGIRPISTDDPSLSALKPLVAQHITQQTNSIYVQGIVSVKSASRQVVAGTLTRMTVEVGSTDCLKSEPRNDISSCKVVPNNSGNHEICDVEIWSRPWLNKNEITSNCRNVQDE
uniref:Venom cystatin n=1 Tax=Lethocerus distinctifemur TaxID=280095 RepID=A0A2K8JVP4_9HEMI|nr:venom cystatin [Lethocerus distinctifemur]